MKKITTIFCIVIFSICSCFLAGCDNNDNKTTKIRLSEVTHSIFYAPLYVAINKGYFSDYGIEIELSVGGGADKVMSAITSKNADIGLLGPEAVIYCQVNGQKNYPIIFGQLTKRDGSFLVAKSPEKNFSWQNIVGKRVLAGRNGGMPAMTLEYVINKNGVSTDSLNFDTSVAFNLMTGVFEADETVDYSTMFEPTASQIVKSGKGYIVTSIGKDSGEIPYTAFTASKSMLDKNPKLIKNFLKAVFKGYEFMISNDLDVVAQTIKPSFTGFDIELIKSSISSYIEIDAWCDSPIMKKSSFDRLQDVMENAKHLNKRADFNKVVNNSFAEEIMS